jgi:hypothetical protein
MEQMKELYRKLENEHRKVFVGDLSDNIDLITIKEDNKSYSFQLDWLDNLVSMNMSLVFWDEEERIKGSKMAHEIGEIIKSESTKRLDFITGLLKIEYDDLIISDFESYNRRMSDDFKKSLPEVLKNIHETCSSVEVREQKIKGRSSNYFEIFGLDGYNLATNLEKLGYARIINDDNMIHRFEFLSLGKGSAKDKLYRKGFVKAIEKLGYNIY